MTPDDPPSRRGGLLDWKGVLGIAISVGFLYWAFRDVSFGEVVHHLREADPWLLGPSVVAATVLFPMRALRWKPLLKPAFPATRFHPRFAATCVGFMANNVLPARMGEFVRAYAITRLEPIRMSASFGSLVVERMFDGLVIVGMLLSSMAWPGFPEVSGRDFRGVALFLGVAFLAMFAVLLLMVINPTRSVRIFEATVGRLLPDRIGHAVVSALEAFLSGVGSVRDPLLLVRILGWSIVLWSTNAVAFWLGFKAFGIDVPLVAGFFLQAVIGLAVALPSAPGFFGVFEAGARIGLAEVWGVESTRAVAFGFGFHIATFIPITLVGLYYVWRLGLSWGEVRTSEEVVEQAVDHPDGAGEPAS